MSDYHPDAWVIVELDSAEHGTINKVLASWYGGFANGDSWKLSSGIESVVFDGEQYTMPQASGSVYICHKDSERMSGIMSGIFSSFSKKAEEEGDFTIKIISINDLPVKLSK